MASDTDGGRAPGLGQEATVAIQRMGLEGEGVGEWPDGRVAFVAGALPGETARARLRDSHRTYVKAVVTELLQIAPERVTPRCPVFPACGGCALQHWDYQAELAYKTQRVREALQRVGHLSGVAVRPILGAENPWHYRNKGQFPWGMADGRPVLGLYRRQSHAVVATDRCEIQDPLINRILPVARSWAERLRLPVYDEATRRGLLRHLLVRTSRWEQKALVLVVGTHFDPRLARFAEAVQEAVPEVAGVGFNENPAPGNRVLGPVTRTLAGRDYLVEQLLGMRFRLSFTAFFQVNPVQVERLYQAALEALPGDADLIWDLYAGVGTLAALASRRAREVWAVEVNPAAVADARKNFAENRLFTVKMEVGSTAEVLQRWLRQPNSPTPAAVILDPPRSGLEAAVAPLLLQARPQRLVYVSCRPETLARDLALLHVGYTVDYLQPVDMFPRTDHVEAVACLTRRA